MLAGHELGAKRQGVDGLRAADAAGLRNFCEPGQAIEHCEDAGRVGGRGWAGEGGGGETRYLAHRALVGIGIAW